MFTTCFKCQKQNDYWESRRQKEPVIQNGKEIFGAFTCSKFFCPRVERKAKDTSLAENEEKILIIDCLEGDRVEIREKSNLVGNQKSPVLSPHS
jgi:hypothetical protein